jgi:hypothetical protein
VNLVAPVRDRIDAWVHRSARQDALPAPRDRAAIAVRLLADPIAFGATGLARVVGGRHA